MQLGLQVTNGSFRREYSVQRGRCGPTSALTLGVGKQKPDLRVRVEVGRTLGCIDNEVDGDTLYFTTLNILA